MPSNSGISIGGRELDPVRGGALMLVIGLAVVGFGAYDYVQQSDAVTNAVEVDATIVETGIETSSQRRGGIDYEPTVTFDYRYEGASYTGENIYPATFTSTYDTRSEAESVLDEHEEGETVTAYVDPDSPGDAFLENKRSDGPLKFMVVGGVFALAGGASIVKSFRGP